MDFSVNNFSTVSFEDFQLKVLKGDIGLRLYKFQKGVKSFLYNNTFVGLNLFMKIVIANRTNYLSSLFNVARTFFPR